MRYLVDKEHSIFLQYTRTKLSYYNNFINMNPVRNAPSRRLKSLVMSLNHNDIIYETFIFVSKHITNLHPKTEQDPHNIDRSLN